MQELQVQYSVHREMWGRFVGCFAGLKHHVIASSINFRGIFLFSDMAASVATARLKSAEPAKLSQFEPS